MIHLGSMNTIANDLLQKATVRKNWKPTGESSRQCSGNKGGERMVEGTCQTRLRISLKYYRELSRVELLREPACIGVLKPLF